MSGARVASVFLCLAMLGPAATDVRAMAEAEGAAGREKATYLGVSVSPVEEALRKHLKLQDSMGLEVSFVDPGSPAAEAGVQKYDILLKLNDQLLVEPRQFQALIRMQKAGETIKFELIREGAAITVPVTLVDREIPPLDLPRGAARTPAYKLVADMRAERYFWVATQGSEAEGGGYPDAPAMGQLPPDVRIRVKDLQGKLVFAWPADLEQKLKALPGEVQEKMKSLVEQFEGLQGEQLKESLEKLPDEIGKLVEKAVQQALNTDDLRDRLKSLPAEVQDYVSGTITRALVSGAGRVTASSGKGHMTVSRFVASYADHKLELRAEDGRKMLRATDKDANVIYDGPIETQEERQKLPPEVRRELEDLDRAVLVSGSDRLTVGMPDGTGIIKAEKVEIQVKKSGDE